MPVYKDKERGTWFVKLSQKDPISGKPKQVLKRGFETKRAASQWEAEYKASKASKSSATFDEMLKKHLDAADSSETTRSMKTNWIHNHFPYYNYRIEDISRADLINWRNELKSGQLATRTMNRGIRYVKEVFSFAEQIYGIHNPAVVLKTFKLSKEDKEEMDTWTPEEFQQFVKHVQSPLYAAFFTFLYWTGCRRGEAMAVCKQDITGNKVHIHRAIKNFKNGFMPLKTDSSERTIPIDSKTLEAIKSFIKHADPFVFGGERSLPISQIQRIFTKAIADSGVKPIRIHDLRHSHATWLINSGVNIVAVSKRLGHASVNQTLKTYTHLLQKTNDEMMDTIEAFKNNG